MSKHSKVSSSTKWRLGESVFLRLMECLTLTVFFVVFFDIFMDNYFTSFRLLTHLGVNNIWATSVPNNANTLSLGANNCKKKKRGRFEQRTSSKKEMQLWRWNDSRAVYIVSSESCEPKSFFGVGTKLKECIFKNNNQISSTVTTRT